MFSETLNIYTHKYADLWLEQTPLPSDEKGYTWDPNTNGMLNYLLPFDDRRMRLDRIILKNSANLSLESIRRFGENKIPGRWNLYPSDHYGLIVTLKMFSKFKPNYDLIEEDLRYKNETGFRPIEKIKGMRYFHGSCLLFLLLVASYLIYSYCIN